MNVIGICTYFFFVLPKIRIEIERWNSRSIRDSRFFFLLLFIDFGEIKRFLNTSRFLSVQMQINNQNQMGTKKKLLCQNGISCMQWVTWQNGNGSRNRRRKTITETLEYFQEYLINVRFLLLFSSVLFCLSLSVQIGKTLSFIWWTFIFFRLTGCLIFCSWYCWCFYFAVEIGVDFFPCMLNR